MFRYAQFWLITENTKLKSAINFEYPKISNNGSNRYLESTLLSFSRTN